MRGEFVDGLNDQSSLIYDLNKFQRYAIIETMLNKFNKTNRNKSTLQLTDLPHSSSPLAQSR